MKQAIDFMRPYLPDMIGVAGLALLVSGVWGLAGWQWAAITAGSLPGGFYVWGQINRVRGAQEGP